MVIRCSGCGRVYDDAAQWTICPHGPLGFRHDEYCPRCDTLKSVHGPCPHQRKDVPSEEAKAETKGTAETEGLRVN